jgi:hypothetical protein
MYNNSEQLSLAEAVIEHWDKYVASTLQFILPENVAFLASVGVGILTKEYAPLFFFVFFVFSTQHA